MAVAPTHAYDGEAIRWYVLEDSDYGIQYLVNDRGGCCVGLDSYGGVVGVSYGAEGADSYAWGNDEMSGTAMIVALIMGLFTLFAIAVRLLSCFLAWLFSACCVLVQS